MAVRPNVFVREAIDELKKVTWPTRAEVTRLSVAVIAISIIVGIFLGGIDFVLTKVIELIVK